MTTGVFLLTAIFVAYVIYLVANENKSQSPSSESENSPSQTATTAVESQPLTVAVTEVKTSIAESSPAPASKQTKPAEAKPAPAVVTAEPETAVVKKPVTRVVKAQVVKAEKAEPAPSAKEPEAGVSGKGSSIKNPATGELTASSTNYRFTKRWLKEALVSEGLIEKVYKNDELTPDIETKIKEAINKLESMDKYKP